MYGVGEEGWEPRGRSRRVTGLRGLWSPLLRSLTPDVSRWTSRRVWSLTEDPVHVSETGWSIGRGDGKFTDPRSPGRSVRTVSSGAGTFETGTDTETRRKGKRSSRDRRQARDKKGDYGYRSNVSVGTTRKRCRLHKSVCGRIVRGTGDSDVP